MTKIESMIRALKKAKAIFVNYYDDDPEFTGFLNIGFDRKDPKSEYFIVTLLETSYSVPCTFCRFVKGSEVHIDGIIDWYFYEIFNTVEDEVIAWSNYPEDSQFQQLI